MKRKIDLESDFGFFKGEIIGTVLVLSFKDNLMFRATSLAAKSTILDYLDQLSRTDAIKVLLIVSSPEKAGREEYCQFYDMVIQSALEISAVHKLFHAVDDLILKIKDLTDEARMQGYIMDELGLTTARLQELATKDFDAAFISSYGDNDFAVNLGPTFQTALANDEFEFTDLEALLRYADLTGDGVVNFRDRDRLVP